MNLLADESVDRQIVTRLREDGCSVSYIAELAPGISDDKVLDSASRENALLLTADKDFGEIVYRQNRLSMGVILIRLAGLSPEKKSEIVSASFRDHWIEFRGAFTVIAPGAIRIRGKTQ